MTPDFTLSVCLYVRSDAGEALLDAGQYVTNVYCSPSLRCVETATEILKGRGFKHLSFPKMVFRESRAFPGR